MRSLALFTLLLLTTMTGAWLASAQEGGDPCYAYVIGDTLYEACHSEIGTLTPSPGSTAVVTETPTPFVTWEPTQEIPTIAPTPEATQGPLKTCQMRALTVLNVRAGTGTEYGIRDKWDQGIEREFSTFDNSDRDYLWGYSDDGAGGWSAIYDKAAESWYASGTQGAVLCPDLPGWPEGLIPPEPFALWVAPSKYGVHLLTSAGSGHLDEFGIIKGISGNSQALKYAHAANPETLLIWRNWTRYIYGSGDGPPDWGQGDPVAVADQWWLAEYSTWVQLGLIEPDRANYEQDVIDLFEYRNELVFAGDWEIAFDLRILELATENNICIAAFSDGYGNPTLAQFDQRAPVLDFMVDNECQPGKRHVISTHSYSRYDSGWWLFDRWLLQRDYWRYTYGDKYDVIQWVFTEFGVKDTDAAPNDYDGRGIANCAVAWAEMPIINAKFAGNPEIIGYTIFGLGNLQPWVNWEICLN